MGYYFAIFAICAINSASQTSVSPTNALQAIVAMPRRTGAANSHSNWSVSPGVTFCLKRTLSMRKK